MGDICPIPYTDSVDQNQPSYLEFGILYGIIDSAALRSDCKKCAGWSEATLGIWYIT